MLLKHPELDDGSPYEFGFRNEQIDSLYKSQKWKSQVLDNPFMHNIRNVLISFSTDGFQPFKHRSSSAWPLNGMVSLLLSNV
jgi:hypothetical protein